MSRLRNLNRIQRTNIDGAALQAEKRPALDTCSRLWTQVSDLEIVN